MKVRIVELEIFTGDEVCVLSGLKATGYIQDCDKYSDECKMYPVNLDLFGAGLIGETVFVPQEWGNEVAKLFGKEDERVMSNSSNDFIRKNELLSIALENLHTAVLVQRYAKDNQHGQNAISIADEQITKALARLDQIQPGFDTRAAFDEMMRQHNQG